MKKIVLFVVLAISMLPVYSQTSVGVIAGYNLNSLSPKGLLKSPTYSLSRQSGWRAGVIAEHHLRGKFYLQPQLILNSKGYNYTYSYRNPYPNEDFSYRGKYSNRYLFLELQANFVFKQELGKGNLVVGAGPYISRGISGIYKSEYEYELNDTIRGGTSYSIVKYRNKIPTLAANEHADNVSYARPYDYGFNCQVGYELKNGLFFNAVYSRGLSRLSYDKSSDYNQKHTYVGLSIGYFLKRFSLM